MILVHVLVETSFVIFGLFFHNDSSCMMTASVKRGKCGPRIFPHGRKTTVSSTVVTAVIVVGRKRSFVGFVIVGMVVVFGCSGIVFLFGSSKDRCLDVF